jgi:hypothetical protein
LGDVLRAALFLVIGVAVAASASSSSNQPAPGPAYGTAPPPQAMEPTRALGLWKSSFGGVRIEEDLSQGGAQAGFLHGYWRYDRAGQEVYGYFAGNLRGNVMQFQWKEPGVPQELVGQGYLVFDPSGQRFSGKWWTTTRDRNGEWTGWRVQSGQEPPQQDPYNTGYDPYGRPPPPSGDPYGGATYGYGYPPPPPSSPY